MSYRTATLIATSADGKRKIFFDRENHDELLEAIKSEKGLSKKFYHIIQLILEQPNGPPRDLYSFENIEKGCEHVTAMKPFPKSDRNMRIFCQHHKTESGKIVVIAAEYLHKKKNQDLKSKEKNIIRKVASYDYDLSKLSD